MYYSSRQGTGRKFGLEFQVTLNGNTIPRIGEGMMFPSIIPAQNRPVEDTAMWSYWHRWDCLLWLGGSKLSPGRVVDVQHGPSSETQTSSTFFSFFDPVLHPAVTVVVRDEEYFLTDELAATYRSRLNQALGRQAAISFRSERELPIRQP